MTGPAIEYRTNPRFVPDNVQVRFGSDGDCRLFFDGVDLVLSPAVVGSGDFKITGAGLLLDSGEGIDFGAGDVSLNHAAGRLQVAGGDLAVPAGGVFIGDSGSVEMTQGLVVNQGSNDDQVLALKSSDVSAGTASLGGTNEADDFGVFRKVHATLGGLNVEGRAGDDAAATTALRMAGIGGTADTAKTTAGRALIELWAFETTGNSLTNITGDGNVLGVVARVGGANRTLLLLDEDGDLFADGGSASTGMVTLFDGEDDVDVVRAFDLARAGRGARGLVRGRFDEFVRTNEDRLVELGILGGEACTDQGARTGAADRPATGTEQGTGERSAARGLINVTRLQQLHNGAIWQIATDLYEVVAALPAPVRAMLPDRLRGKAAALLATKGS